MVCAIFFTNILVVNFVQIYVAIILVGFFLGDDFYLHQSARRDLVKILLTGEKPQKNYGH